MNRTQRRAAMRAEKRRGSMGYEKRDIPMQIKHGHDGRNVVVIFSQPVPNMAFTPEQAQAFIDSMKHSMEALAAHKANPAPAQEAANG
jgi:hypothetical protein